MPQILSKSHIASLYALKLSFVTFYHSLSFVLEALFRGVNQKMSEKHINNFSQGLLKASKTTLEPVGLENIDPNKSYIYMSNHNSAMDIPAILSATPQSVRMIAKEALFKVPFFGRAMSGAGFIPIDRNNLEKAKLQLKLAKKKVESGISIWIAPEGTRNPNRNIDLMPFKKGGFHTAINIGVPIIPVWIKGAHKIIPANKFSVYTHQKISVIFGKPIQTHNLNKTQIAALMTKVREAILAQALYSLEISN